MGGGGSDSSKLIGCKRHFPFKEGWGEGKAREFEIDISTLLCLKWITNKDLLSSAWNMLSAMRQPGGEGRLGENVYIYVYDRVPSLSA